MNLNINKLAATLSLALALQSLFSQTALASGLFAQANNGNGNGNSNQSAPPPASGLPSNYESILGSGIRNPLKAQGTIEFLFTLMQNFLIVIVVITVAMIVYGGLRLLTSSGSEAGVKAGKQTVLWAVIGLAIALLSFSIIGALKNYLDRLK